jgi:hypothetical protein
LIFETLLTEKNLGFFSQEFAQNGFSIRNIFFSLSPNLFFSSLLQILKSVYMRFGFVMIDLEDFPS